MRNFVIVTLGICVFVSLAFGPSNLTVGQESDQENLAGAYETSAGAPQSELKKEIESGVWVIGKSHRFAEVGRCDYFALSPDGMTVACNGSKIKLFDLNENRVRDTVGEENEYYQTVNYSPDGRYLVAHTNRQGEAIIRVWDAIDLSLVNTISTKQGVESPSGNSNFYIQDLVVSPDSSFVAASSYNVLMVRDLKTGELVAHLDKLGYVQSAAFSPDESLIYFSENNRFQVVELASGDKLSSSDCRLAGLAGSTLDVNYSRNIAVAIRSNSVQLIELDGSNFMRTYALPSGCYGQRVAFSDDGSLLAVVVWQTSGGNSNRMGLVVMDSETGRVVRHSKQVGQNVRSLRFSTDNQTVFYIGYGGYGINEIDLTTDVSAVESDYPTNPASVTTFHPDNKSFVACTITGEVSVFDMETGEIQSSFKHPNPTRMCISEDGVRVVISSSYGQSGVASYDFRTGKKKKEYSIKSTGNRTISMLKSFLLRGGPSQVRNQTYPLGFVFSNDGQAIFLVAMQLTMVNSGDWMTGFDNEQTMSIQFAELDAESGQMLKSRRFSFEQFGLKNNQWMRVAAASPNGNLIAVANGNGVTIVDTESGDNLYEIVVENEGQPVGQVTSVTFSPDSKTLVTNSVPGQIHVWDTESGALVKKLDLENPGRVFASFANNGKRLAVCGAPRKSAVHIYDTKSWETVFQREESQHERLSIAISDGGQFVVLGLSDCRMELWDLGQLR